MCFFFIDLSVRIAQGRCQARWERDFRADFLKRSSEGKWTMTGKHELQMSYERFCQAYWRWKPDGKGLGHVRGEVVGFGGGGKYLERDGKVSTVPLLRLSWIALGHPALVLIILDFLILRHLLRIDHRSSHPAWCLLLLY